MSKKLEEIRKKIDALDNKIHDALMARADLVATIKTEKKKQKIPFIQPAREAALVRRLMARHKGPMPVAAMTRIWRELIAAISLMQIDLKVMVVSSEDGRELLWDLAKSYFGSVVPMQRTSSPLVAIAALREDECSYAVLPWPHDGEAEAWWPVLFNQENEQLNIVSALPFAHAKDETMSWENRAIVLSKAEFNSSERDGSFVILCLSQNVSRSRIVDEFKNIDLEPLSVSTVSNPDQVMCLVEVSGFVSIDDERLKALEEKFEEQHAVCKSIGGYPISPVYARSPFEKQGDNGIPVAPKTKKGR